jgi:hypothetical protein
MRGSKYPLLSTTLIPLGILLLGRGLESLIFIVLITTHWVWVLGVCFLVSIDYLLHTNSCDSHGFVRLVIMVEPITCVPHHGTGSNEWKDAVFYLQVPKWND